MAIAQLKSVKTLYQTLIKRLLPLLLGVLASLAILLLWQQLTINEELHIEQLIQQQTNAIELGLNKELSSRMLTLKQMANRWQVSGGTAKELWQADAAAYIKNFSGYQAIEWVDPSFKVRWIVPLAGNEAAQNLDLSREPRRRIALQMARNSRQPILSRNISLSQGGKGILAIFPLFVGDRFDGFIIGVFKVKTLFDNILKVPPGYKVAIYDGTESIYSQELPSQSLLQKIVVIKAWQADWRLEVFSTPALIAESKSILPIVVLIGGLFLVFLFVLVVYLTQISYQQIDRFKKANRQLEWEIHQRKQAESELGRLAAIVESSEDAIISKDLEGLVTSWNKGAEIVFGYTASEMLGKSGRKLIPPDYQEQEKEISNRIKRGERTEHYDTKRTKKDGTLIDVSISVSPIKDETGKLIGSSKIARNIADRKRNEAERQQAEQALRESEARFQTFMNNSPAPAWITDANGVMLYASQTYFRTFELPTDDIIGKSIFELYPTAIAQQFLENIQTVTKTCKVLETVEVVPRLDGTLGDFLVYKFLIPDLLEQRLVGGVAIDITQQHQIETALQMSEKRLILALEASGDGLWDWNIKTGEVYLDSHYQEMLGYNPGELVMDLRLWEQIIHPDDKSWVFEYLDKHLQDSSFNYAFDYRVGCKSGEWKWIANYGKVVDYDEQGKPLRMIGTHKDISDRKRKELALHQAMEAAEAANLAKSIFLANMSHELRTPLNVILGFAQVMAHDPSLTPNQQKDLQTIRRSGDHLLSLINDILDLSKIESGHCTIEKSGFDLIALLHSLRNMLAERASSKGLDLYFEIAPEVPQFILADPQKLRQVLLNLLSNAIKFTEIGSITLHVNTLAPSTKATPTTEVILQFVVTDTGVGIALADLHTIFDAFVQAQAGKRSTNGTGLGLTISRKLVELMGGEISVRSILGQGSTFIFNLPASPIGGVNITPEQNDRLVMGLAPGHPHHRILVVDDRAENRLLMIKLLRQLKLEVREAANGQEAVEIWQEWQPDLTWMDIRMPVLDGYEATKQIRALERGKSSIIIALTAQASQSDRTLALAAGCNDYISKPFREQTLFLKMAEYLNLEYIYQQDETVHQEKGTDGVSSSFSAVASPILDFLEPTLLATLSKVWVAQLEDAAVCGNDGEILELVDRLPPELAQLGTRLSELANQYQFEKIIKLIRDNFPS